MATPDTEIPAAAAAVPVDVTKTRGALRHLMRDVQTSRGTVGRQRLTGAERSCTGLCHVTAAAEATLVTTPVFQGTRAAALMHAQTSQRVTSLQFTRVSGELPRGLQSGGRRILRVALVSPAAAATAVFRWEL